MMNFKFCLMIVMTRAVELESELGPESTESGLFEDSENPGLVSGRVVQI